MSENIVTIETYDSVAKAHLAKSKLEAFGIECFLADENIIGLNPLYNQALGGIKLKYSKKTIRRQAKYSKRNIILMPKKKQMAK
jgi:hypothetical protein